MSIGIFGQLKERKITKNLPPIEIGLCYTTHLQTLLSAVAKMRKNHTPLLRYARRPMFQLRLHVADFSVKFYVMAHDRKSS